MDFKQKKSKIMEKTVKDLKWKEGIATTGGFLQERKSAGSYIKQLSKSKIFKG